MMRRYVCTICLKERHRHWFARRGIQRSLECRDCLPHTYTDERPKTACPSMWGRYRMMVVKAIRKGGRVITYPEYLDLMADNTCVYCKEAAIPEGSTATAYGLDRKDNTRGYELDNVVPCCGVCNFTRGNRFTHEEFLQLGPSIRNLYQPKRSVV